MANEAGRLAGTRSEQGPEAVFRRFLMDGRLMLQRSRVSGRCVFYPRVTFPATGETDLEWVEAAGGGVVYATTTVRRRPEQGGPYNVALIDLDEGVRCMSRVEEIEPHQVRIGLRVRARIDRVDGTAVLVFVPAQEPTGDHASR